MKNTRDKFFIGIDSGGTKCELLITDSELNVILNRSYEGIHYSLTGAEKYSIGICNFIHDALKRSNLKIKNCSSLSIGVAGARQRKDRIKIKRSFRKRISVRNILITTDAMTALYGAFEGDEGIILISGTGSVFYGYSEGSITRIGGWGRIIGDEGSGFWIGKRALNLTMKEFDNPQLKRSLLSNKLEEKFGINGRNAVEKVFHDNFEVQRIAPVVIELASRRCELSRSIIVEAVSELTELFKTFLRVTGRKKKIKAAFIGGIIENDNIVSHLLKKKLKELKYIEVVKKKHSASFGAVLLAVENSTLANKLLI